MCDIINVPTLRIESDEMEQKQRKPLNKNISNEMKDRIWDSGACEECKKPVYRVSKKGIISIEAFISTYEEILAKELPDFPGRYPRDKVGTYSTSVYLDRGPCDKFINCLKKGVVTRKKYPYPIVMEGKTSNGLAQRTIDREPDHEDPYHVDWWIFEGENELVVPNFFEA